MYNKLFTKILDSSIWLAPDPHRIVWITLIAAMNQDGIAEFACAANLAARARVSLEDTEAALKAFISPDPHAPEQEFEGKRIERVPGGWFILNAEKYRNLTTRAVASEQARIRMQRHREKLRNVTQPLRTVTPSDSYADSDNNKTYVEPKRSTDVDSVFVYWRKAWNHPGAKLDAKRQKVITAALKLYPAEQLCKAISGYLKSPHHTGQNDRNTVYDDIEIFLRDAKHIDAGLKFAEQPTVRKWD